MKIKSNKINGFIATQIESTNSITFYGNLPEGVKVKNIRLIGEIEVNGKKMVNPILNDVDGIAVGYHLNSTDDSIATAYFIDEISEQIIADVQNYILNDFEIECIEICLHCGRF